MNDTIVLRGSRESNGLCVEYVRPLSSTGELVQHLFGQHTRSVPQLPMAAMHSLLLDNYWLSWALCGTIGVLP